jgi:hypothetical protein
MLVPSSSFPRRRIGGWFGQGSRSGMVHWRNSRHNLKEGLLEKTKLAQHAYEEGHKVGWDENWKLKVTGVGNTRNRPIWHV